jgi:hypothetical protein
MSSVVDSKDAVPEAVPEAISSESDYAAEGAVTDTDAAKGAADTPLVPNMAKSLKKTLNFVNDILDLNPKQFGNIVVDTGKEHFLEGAALIGSLTPFFGSYFITGINSSKLAGKMINEMEQKIDKLVPPIEAPVVEPPTVVAQGGGKYKNIIQLGGINTKNSNAIIRRINNSRKIFNNTNKCNNANNKSNKFGKINNKFCKNKTYKGEKHMKTKRMYK